MASHPETLLISAIIRSRDHVTPMTNGIKQSLFHLHPEEWQWIERYIRLRRRTPSRQAFKNKFPGFTILAVDDVEFYCDEVKQSHVRHTLIDLMDDTADRIESSSDMMDAVKHLHSEVIALTAQVAGQEFDTDIADSWKGIYEDVADKVARVEEKGMPGIPTGFTTLDERTGGPGPGDYWVIAGRLAQGKTWTGIRMGCAAAFAGYSVQYFALEQSRTQIALRVHTFMASEYGKSLFKHIDLQQGKNFRLKDYRNFLKSLKSHLPGKFYVNDQSSGRVSALTIAAQIELHQPDIVFVDYLTLMEKDSDEWQSIASLSADIKSLSQQYQIPIVVLAQINRSGGGKEPPGTEYIAQSDRIGQDADAVITLTKRTPHVIKMKLAKYRHGQDGYTWWCKFSPNTGHFDEVTGDEAQDIMDNDMEDDF